MRQERLDLRPVCEVGIDIAARATVTRDLCLVCEMGVDIEALVTVTRDVSCL
jgi:hypothetical protein